MGPEETNAIEGTVSMTEYQGTWVKVAIERKGFEEVVAHVSDDQFFSKPVNEGDQVIVRWSKEGVHPLAHDSRMDVSQLYGEDFNSTRI